ncbi:MAG: tryptophan synthase subunit alpha [Phycisphaeraceae bacterium]|nr:tryptophan synthase subunit alpha [Phycisphaeraceae bacterium]
MNRIDAAFARARERRGRLLMPFICGGFPLPNATGMTLQALQAGGADIVEVGIPFSDPIADGPVIAGAMHRAIAAGSTPESVIDQVADVRDSLSIGVVAMVSISIVHRLGGLQGFIPRLVAAGFDGVIVPDLPLEEGIGYREAAATAGLTFSHLIAPTTPRDRASDLARASSGFVYLIARTGITGERSDIPDVAERVASLRRSTDLPIACGFGISTAEQVRAVVAHADAAIVGSAMVKRIDAAAARGENPAGAAEQFCRELRSGMPPA